MRLFRVAPFLLILALVTGGCSAYEIIDKDQNAVEYSVSAQKIDIGAMDSYPQRVLSHSTDGNIIQVNVRVELDNRRYQQTPLESYEYPPEVSRFLMPSEKIESDSPIIAELSGSIAKDEKDILRIAESAVKWISKNIKYDTALAERISRGESDSESALATIESKKGTCGECANVFIAIMRSKGVPARFASGVIYEGGEHAWAEVFLHNTGWVPVEPQGGYLGITNRYIKLFDGADFAEIGVGLDEIRAVVQKNE